MAGLLVRFLLRVQARAPASLDTLKEVWGELHFSHIFEVGAGPQNWGSGERLHSIDVGPSAGVGVAWVAALTWCGSAPPLAAASCIYIVRAGPLHRTPSHSDVMALLLLLNHPLSCLPACLPAAQVHAPWLSLDQCLQLLYSAAADRLLSPLPRTAVEDVLKEVEQQEGQRQRPRAEQQHEQPGLEETQQHLQSGPHPQQQQVQPQQVEQQQVQPQQHEQEQQEQQQEQQQQVEHHRHQQHALLQQEAAARAAVAGLDDAPWVQPLLLPVSPEPQGDTVVQQQQQQQQQQAVPPQQQQQQWGRENRQEEQQQRSPGPAGAVRLVEAVAGGGQQAGAASQVPAGLPQQGAEGPLGAEHPLHAELAQLPAGTRGAAGASVAAEGAAPITGKGTQGGTSAVAPVAAGAEAADAELEALLLGGREGGIPRPAAAVRQEYNQQRYQQVQVDGLSDTIVGGGSSSLGVAGGLGPAPMPGSQVPAPLPPELHLLPPQPQVVMRFGRAWLQQPRLCGPEEWARHLLQQQLELQQQQRLLLVQQLSSQSLELQAGALLALFALYFAQPDLRPTTTVGAAQVPMGLGAAGGAANRAAGSDEGTGEGQGEGAAQQVDNAGSGGGSGSGGGTGAGAPGEGAGERGGGGSRRRGSSGDGKVRIYLTAEHRAALLAVLPRLQDAGLLDAVAAVRQLWAAMAFALGSTRRPVALPADAAGGPEWLAGLTGAPPGSAAGEYRQLPHCWHM